jgi:pimeloyl-ACP methyl ester carboxylesterase
MKTIFLPGAGGSAAFWKPVGQLLGGADKQVFFSWPGLGDEPPDANIRSFDDLVAHALAAIDGPCNLVAQSMGGLVAALCALAKPEQVRRLALVATSAGVPIEAHGAADWRPDYRSAFPKAAPWIADVQIDLSDRLPSIRAPVLLIWGDSDPISPVAVGRRLNALLPHSTLRVIASGDHDLAVIHADEIAELIRDHLTGPA